MKISPVSTLFLALLTFLVGMHPGSAESPITSQRLIAPNAAMGDRFGSAVDVIFPYLLVGAPDRGDGAAYFYRKLAGGGLQPWEFRDYLIPTGLTPGARFGTSVASQHLDSSLAGPRIAVGAPFYAGASEAEGIVYFFNYGLTQESTLQAPVPELGAAFGFSLAASRRSLVIGAPYQDSDIPDTGRVYFYRAVYGGSPFATYMDWEFVADRRDPNRDPSTNFGYAVANDDETVVVGAPSINDDDPGTASIYSRNQGGADRWGLVHRLLSPDTRPSARFGWAVAVDGDLAAVSALGAGRVYLFGRDTGGPNQWGQIASVSASDDGRGFGWSVALSGNLLVVGAPLHEAGTGTPGQGAVYFYEPDPVKGWREIGSLTSPAVPYDGFYGGALAMEGPDLAVGTPFGGTVIHPELGVTTMMTVLPAESPPGNLIVNGSFTELTSEPFTGGFPTGTGYWKGDSTAEVSAANSGITPVLRSLMLKFAATGTIGNPTTSGTCALYQLVDVTPYADRIATGHVVATLSFAANRVAGDSRTDDEFQAQLRSYNGNPANFISDLSNHTGSATAIRHTDDNPDFWETFRTELTLPPGTTYLAARISAVENTRNDIVTTEFDGHYADNATLTLRVDPPRPEILAIELENNFGIRVRFTTEPAFHYSLQRSTDLRRWTTVCWNIPGTGGPREVTVRGGELPATYYRIVAGW